MRKRIFIGLAVAAAAVGGATTSAQAAPSECPTGWVVQGVPSNSIFDKNGDGTICTNDIPGNGAGNSLNSQRNPGQPGFHLDGHNHKDNNI